MAPKKLLWKHPQATFVAWWPTDFNFDVWYFFKGQSLVWFEEWGNNSCIQTSIFHLITFFQVGNSSGNDMNTCQTENSKQYLEIAYNHSNTINKLSLSVQTQNVEGLATPTTSTIFWVWNTYSNSQQSSFFLSPPSLCNILLQQTSVSAVKCTSVLSLDCCCYASPGIAVDKVKNMNVFIPWSFEIVCNFKSG